MPKTPAIDNMLNMRRRRLLAQKKAEEANDTSGEKTTPAKSRHERLARAQKARQEMESKKEEPVVEEQEPKKESAYTRSRRARLVQRQETSSTSKETPQNLNNLFAKTDTREVKSTSLPEEPYKGDAILDKEDMIKLADAPRVSNRTLNNLPSASFKFSKFPKPDRINDNQVRYPGLSRPDKITAVIPEMIYEATLKSLTTLKTTIKEQYGVDSVDEFVGSKMDWSVEEVAEKLSPEQTDSVAMGIVAIDKSSSMLVADVTGFGKGRIMATLLTYGLESKGMAMFLSEKANLFSDMWRDLRDIGCDVRVGRPFIVNNGAKIIDLKTREQIFKSWKPKEHKKILESGEMPKGYRLVFSTYSQFGVKDTNKRDFISKVTKGGHLATDEVQNISRQEANVTQFMTDVIANMSSVIDASASSGSEISNLRSYRRIFPWLVFEDYESMDKERQVWASGESVISSVSEGRILRRETDMSGMELSMDTIESHHPYMIEMQDAFSRVMLSLSKLDAAISYYCYQENENNKDEVKEWDYNNLHGFARGPRPKERTLNPFSFGGRLNILCTHFITCLMAPMAIDMVEDSIRPGERPVVVIDSTMENILKSILDGEASEDNIIDLDDDAVESDEVVPEDGDHPETDEVPSFRDMLLAVLKRVPLVSCREKGVRKPEKIDISEEVPDFDYLNDQCLEAINDFPTLDISPIDIIREEIEHRGKLAYEAGDIIKPWKCGEISGRKMRISNGAYETIPKEELDRNSLMSRFNYNDINSAADDGNDITVMLLTRSGSTGASMHDAEQFPGPFKRRMFDVLPPASTKQRLQMYGRTERRGSRTKCGYTTISTPLPWHYFTLISQNKKMEALAASVAGSKDSAVGHKDLPDFLNRTGDRVAQIFLARNGDLTGRMRIHQKDNDEEARRSLYYVSTLFRRLAMLSYEEQERVIRDYMEAYARTTTMDSSVLSQRLAGRWQLGKCWTLERGSIHGTTSVDTDDVVIARLHRKVDMPALRYADVMAVAQANLRAWNKELGGKLRKYRNHINRRDNLIEYLSRFAYGDEANVEELMMDKKTTVSARDREVERASNMLSRLTPCAEFHGANEEGDSRLGVIVDIIPPQNMEDAYEYFQYVIKYALPGDYRVRSTTLEDMLTNGAVYRLGETSSHACHAVSDMQREFQLDRSDIPTTITIHALLGNVNKAILLSERISHGQYVTFRTDDDLLRSAVIIPESKIIAASKSSIRLQTKEAALNLMEKEKGVEINSYDKRRGAKTNMTTYIMFSYDKKSKRYVVNLPQNDMYIKRYIKSPWFCEAVGQTEQELFKIKKSLEKEGLTMSFSFDEENVHEFVDACYKNGVALFANGRKRVTINRVLKTC